MKGGSVRGGSVRGDSVRDGKAAQETLVHFPYQWGRSYSLWVPETQLLACYHPSERSHWPQLGECYLLRNIMKNVNFDNPLP